MAGLRIPIHRSFRQPLPLPVHPKSGGHRLPPGYFGLMDASGNPLFDNFGNPLYAGRPPKFRGVNVMNGDNQFLMTETAAGLDKFGASNVNFVRAPLTWDTLQPVPGAALDEARLVATDAYVAKCRSYGQKVLLDCHSSYRHGGNIAGAPGSPVTTAHIVDFWQRMVERFPGDDLYIGVQNEPHDMATNLVNDNTNAVVAAICPAIPYDRVIIPVNNYNGAQQFDGTSDVPAKMGQIDHLTDGLIVDIHLYFDGAGGTSTRTNENTWTQLVAPTVQAKAMGFRLYLGEVGMGFDGPGTMELNRTLTFVENTDVWAGWTYWGYIPSEPTYFHFPHDAGGEMFRRYMQANYWSLNQ
jgi:hypothetical protein